MRFSVSCCASPHCHLWSFPCPFGAQLNGTYYDSSVVAKAMLEDYTGAVTLRPAAFLPSFAYGKTYAAMLMNEVDGRTIYFFFFVGSPRCRWCNSTTSCIVGTVFEAAYDVSGIDFPQLHCFYDPESCEYSSRRRLLSSEARGWGEGRRPTVHAVDPAKSLRRMRRLLQTTSLSQTKPSVTKLVTCYWVNNCGTKPRTSKCYYQVCK